MGRHAKYYSLAQQASASRKSSLKGRITRAASHRPAQRRKVPSAPPGTLPDLPVLPMPTTKMLELYDQALPHGAQLFEDALRSPDAHDDTTDPYSPAYLAFTKSLAEVLHGVRLREQNVRDIELREAPEISEMWIRWERTKGILDHATEVGYMCTKKHESHSARVLQTNNMVNAATKAVTKVAKGSTKVAKDIQNL
ncbi:hypothetical protein B0H13DRAFT_1887594 [Mycena leptocephala]|nr:hypothetical protein B0H13DRAFT_1887594 [Mycena leptocephala]